MTRPVAPRLPVRRVHGQAGRTTGAPPLDERVAALEQTAANQSRGFLHWIQENPLLFAAVTSLASILIGSALRASVEHSISRSHRRERMAELQELHDQWARERREAALVSREEVEAVDRMYTSIADTIARG